MERPATLACIFAAAGLVVAAVLGPIGLDIVKFHMNRNAMVQYIGGEVITLTVAVGLLICAWLWNSSPSLAPTVTIGMALYVMYTFITVVMGEEFELFPEGNVERYFLLYMAITGLASVLVVLSMNRLIQQDALVSDGWRRGTQWVLGLQATFFAFTWLVQILNMYRGGFTETEKEARALFWLVKYLDLGFMVPIAFLTIVLLHNHQPFAPTLVFALTGFTTWMLLAVAGMAASLKLHGESGGSWVLAGGMILLAMTSIVIWLTWARSVVTG